MLIERMEIITSHVVTPVSPSWAVIRWVAQRYRRDEAKWFVVRARPALRDGARGTA
jgi:hypothetical protein